MAGGWQSRMKAGKGWLCCYPLIREATQVVRSLNKQLAQMSAAAAAAVQFHASLPPSSGPLFFFFFSFLPSSHAPRHKPLVDNVQEFCFDPCTLPPPAFYFVGLIDSTYRGTLKVPLDNPTSSPYTIKKNTRMFQLADPNLVPFEVKRVKELDETARGEGGFGSTGGTND